MQSDERPISGEKHDDRDLPGRQILLMVKILICRDEGVETVRFGSTKQFAVRELVPTAFEDSFNRMRG